MARGRLSGWGAAARRGGPSYRAVASRVILARSPPADASKTSLPRRALSPGRQRRGVHQRPCRAASAGRRRAAKIAGPRGAEGRPPRSGGRGLAADSRGDLRVRTGRKRTLTRAYRGAVSRPSAPSADPVDGFPSSAAVFRFIPCIAARKPFTQPEENAAHS